jgi:hypothetical protein
MLPQNAVQEQPKDCRYCSIEAILHDFMGPAEMSGLAPLLKIIVPLFSELELYTILTTTSPTFDLSFSTLVHSLRKCCKICYYHGSTGH